MNMRSKIRSLVVWSGVAGIIIGLLLSRGCDLFLEWKRQQEVGGSP